MPFWDWQFLVVSLVAAAALWVLVRQVMPRRSAGNELGGAACANCPSHVESAPSKARTRTTTTPVVSLSDLRETARLKSPRRDRGL